MLNSVNLIEQGNKALLMIPEIEFDGVKTSTHFRKIWYFIRFIRIFHELGIFRVQNSPKLG